MTLVPQPVEFVRELETQTADFRAAELFRAGTLSARAALLEKATGDALTAAANAEAAATAAYVAAGQASTAAEQAAGAAATATSSANSAAAQASAAYTAANNLAQTDIFTAPTASGEVACGHPSAWVPMPDMALTLDSYGFLVMILFSCELLYTGAAAPGNHLTAGLFADGALNGATQQSIRQRGARTSVVMVVVGRPTAGAHNYAVLWQGTGNVGSRSLSILRLGGALTQETRMPQLTPLYLDTPATGFSPVFYDGRAMRAALAGLQAGVMGAGDLKVTTAAGVSVSVAPGMAFVEGTQIAYQGLYGIELTSPALASGSFEAGGIPAPNASAPRLDQIIARIYDHVADGLGALKWRLAVLAGTPTGGATLDNRSGAAALPVNSLRLADVLVPQSASSIPAGNVRDRRPWARGAAATVNGTANTPTHGGGGFVDMPEMVMWLETVGPVRMTFSGSMQHGSAGASLTVLPAVDDVHYSQAAIVGGSYVNGAIWPAAFSVIFTPGPGRHKFAVRWDVTAATGYANSNRRVLTVEEIVGGLTPQN